MIKINNNVQEKYCSYVVSKLLKEKGFDIQTKYMSAIISEHYEMQYGSGKYWEDELGEELIPEKFIDKSENRERIRTANTKEWCYIPTQALAIEWICANFNIWISTDFDGKGWFEVITILPNKDRIVCNLHETSEKSIESSILYTLKELIYEYSDQHS